MSKQPTVGRVAFGPPVDKDAEIRRLKGIVRKCHAMLKSLQPAACPCDEDNEYACRYCQVVLMGQKDYQPECPLAALLALTEATWTA